MPGRQLIVGKQIIDLGKRCSLWPDCACHENLVHWQQNLMDEEIVWSLEELRGIETLIFITLTCVAAYCPNKKIRLYAQCQLANRYWDRQRRGEELSEEEFRRRRGIQ